MKKLLIVLMAICIMISMSIAVQAFEIEGSFSWLPIAGSLTAGTNIPILSTLKENPVTNLDKVLNASSIKLGIDYVLDDQDDEQFEDEAIPDYAGVKAGINLLKLASNFGLTSNPNLFFGLDTGVLFDVRSLLDKPSTLKIEPMIGASLKLRF